MSECLCTVCGAVGRPKKKAPGSIATEVVMWLLFCAPGLIYSIWRLSCPLRLCAHCGSQAIIPTDSPVAKQRLAQAGVQAGRGYLDGHYLQPRPEVKKQGLRRFVWLLIFAFIGFAFLVVLGILASNQQKQP